MEMEQTLDPKFWMVENVLFIAKHVDNGDEELYEVGQQDVSKFAELIRTVNANKIAVKDLVLFVQGLIGKINENGSNERSENGSNNAFSQQNTSPSARNIPPRNQLPIKQENSDYSNEYMNHSNNEDSGDGTQSDDQHMTNDNQMQGQQDSAPGPARKNQPFNYGQPFGNLQGNAPGHPYENNFHGYPTNGNALTQPRDTEQSRIQSEMDINFLECPTCAMKTRGEEEMRQHIRNVHINPMNGSPPNKNLTNGPPSYMNPMNDMSRNNGPMIEPSMNMNPIEGPPMHMNQMNNAPIPLNSTNPPPKRRAKNNGTRDSQMEEFERGDPSDGKEMFSCKEYTGEGVPCTFQTAYRLNLKRHITIVHEKIKDFICQIPLCDFRTAQSGNLKRHLQTVHKGHPEIDEAIKSVPPQNYFKNLRGEQPLFSQERPNYNGQDEMPANQMTNHNPGANMVFCNLCNFSTDNTFNLHRHKEENHVKPPYSSAANVSNEIKTEIKPDPDDQTEYSQNMTPQMTQMSHTQDNQHNMIQDPNSFEPPSNPIQRPMTVDGKIDIDQYKTPEGTYKCNECPGNKAFKYPGKLDVHIKAVHMKLKEFSCPNCSFETAYSFELSRHQRQSACGQNNSTVGQQPPHPIQQDQVPQQPIQFSQLPQQPMPYSHQPQQPIQPGQVPHQPMQPGQVSHQPMQPGQAPHQPYQSGPYQQNNNGLPGTYQQNDNFSTPTTQGNTNNGNSPASAKGQVNRYPCPYCPFLTSLSAEMQAHLRTHSQPQSQPQPSPNGMNKDVNFNQTGNPKIQSEMVDQQVNTHMQEFNQGNGNIPTNEQTPKLLGDKIGPDGLIEGAQKINGELTCTYCQKTFKYPAKVNVHIKAVHLKIQDLACTKCEFKTTYNFKLQNHLKTQNHF